MVQIIRRTSISDGPVFGEQKNVHPSCSDAIIFADED